MSNDEKFKEGDVVTLKSGGPLMTVVRYMEDKGVRCTWFVEHKHNVAVFEEATLELVEEDDDTPAIMTG